MHSQDTGPIINTPTHTYHIASVAVAADALAVLNNLSQMILTTTDWRNGTGTSLFILMYATKRIVLAYKRKYLTKSSVTIKRHMYDKVDQLYTKSNNAWMAE